MSKDTIYIFDISNMIHRAFYATGELTTSQGFPTGAIWGTLNMMLRFIDKYQPTHMLVCYDCQEGKSVRKAIYPEYKANRVQANSVSSEELIIRRIFDMLNIPSVKATGYEADDLIGWATKKLKSDMDVVIVTGDKDMLQLIEPGVKVFDTMKMTWYDDSEAQKKFGVKANQIADYLALTGDKVDNIPGCRGIGPVAARALLASYKDIEDIYANIDMLDIKFKNKLIKNKDEVLISKKLTSLFDDIEIDISPEFTLFKPKDNPEIFDLFDKLEFKNMKIKLELMWQKYN